MTISTIDDPIIEKNTLEKNDSTNSNNKSKRKLGLAKGKVIYKNNIFEEDKTINVMFYEKFIGLAVPNVLYSI